MTWWAFKAVTMYRPSPCICTTIEQTIIRADESADEDQCIDRQLAEEDRYAEAAFFDFLLLPLFLLLLFDLLHNNTRGCACVCRIYVVAISLVAPNDEIFAPAGRPTCLPAWPPFHANLSVVARRGVRVAIRSALF